MIISLNSWYTEEELKQIGFQSIGKGCQISRKTSIYNPQKMSIGNYVRIDDFVILSDEITLGHFVHIAPYSCLNGRNGIEMEDFSTVSIKTSIVTSSSNFSGEFMACPQIPSDFLGPTNGKIVLKKHTILGAHSVILQGLTLAEGSVVGANSLVLKDTEEWTIYCGSPARKLAPRKKNPLELEKEFRAKYKEMFE